MGVTLKIGNYEFQNAGFSVQEAATPLAAGDSSGSAGSFTVTLPMPDPDMRIAPAAFLTTGWGQLVTWGPDYLLDQTVTLTDTRKGFTIGRITGVGRNDGSGMLSLTCTSLLVDLNVYGVEAQPYVGTLGGAFIYYLSLAGFTSGYAVDATITSRSVVIPGWQGELWFYLKQLAAAQDCEIALVSGVITLRPIRAVSIPRWRDTDRSRDLPEPTLAQSIEIYLYNNRSITNELVYPPGGWSPEVEVLNVNAGEKAVYQIALSASVSSIQQPVMGTNVGPTYSSSSVYTIVANDGLPVDPALWAAQGGYLLVEINPDTTSLTVTIQGPMGIPTSQSEEATNFSVALGSDTTGNRYSTLRIVGTGVAFNKVKWTLPTAVPASRTGTVVGVTIDNPFISTHNQMFQSGTRAAQSFAGPMPTLSGTILNSSNDNSGQTFGNVNGARVYDKKSRRYYRVRSGDLSVTGTDFQADDDLTMGDVDTVHAAQTYAQVLALFPSMTYRQVELAGLYNGV